MLIELDNSLLMQYLERGSCMSRIAYGAFAAHRRFGNRLVWKLGPRHNAQNVRMPLGMLVL